VYNIYIFILIKPMYNNGISVLLNMHMHMCYPK